MAYLPALLGGLFGGIGSGLEQQNQNRRQAALLALQLGGSEALTPGLLQTLGYNASPATVGNLRETLRGREQFDRFSRLPAELQRTAVRNPRVQEMLRQVTGYETPYQTESVDVPGLSVGGSGIFDSLKTEPSRYEYQAPIYPLTEQERLGAAAQTALLHSLLTAQNKQPTETTLLLNALGPQGMSDYLKQKAYLAVQPKTPFQKILQSGTPEQQDIATLSGGQVLPGPNAVHQGNITTSEGTLNRAAREKNVLLGQAGADARQQRSFQEQNQRALSRIQATIDREARALNNRSLESQYRAAANSLTSQFKGELALGNKPNLDNLLTQLQTLRQQVFSDRPAPARPSDQDLVDFLTGKKSTLGAK